MKKFLALAVLLVSATPVSAITLHEAHVRFDHLIGTNHPSFINHIVNQHCQRMVEQTGAAPDDAIFMHEFGNFLSVMFRIAQSASQGNPAGMANALTALIIRAYELRMNVSSWTAINPLDKKLAGAFAECLPTDTLINAFAQANQECSLAGRSPLALLANAAQLLAYIQLVRKCLHQADQGLGALEAFIKDPSSVLSVLGQLAQAK